MNETHCSCSASSYCNWRTFSLDQTVSIGPSTTSKANSNHEYRPERGLKVYYAPLLPESGENSDHCCLLINFCHLQCRKRINGDHSLNSLLEQVVINRDRLLNTRTDDRSYICFIRFTAEEQYNERNVIMTYETYGSCLYRFQKFWVDWVESVARFLLLFI
ncbi:hypothetical protein ACOME3_006976 [Neoechinorhynchus agilis]